jgi:hypothetical protein
MADHPLETMKVKPWGEGQGDHVLINASDFDPEKHTALGDEPKKPARKAKA